MYLCNNKVLLSNEMLELFVVFIIQFKHGL